MKKLISLLLVFTLSVFAFVSCGNDEDGNESDTDTNSFDTENDTNSETTDTTISDTESSTDDRETDPGEDLIYEANMYPYNGEFVPCSVSEWEWGAPDTESVYFPVATENIIHDGKGTWGNLMEDIGPSAFDGDVSTFYDTDEFMEYENLEDANYGIPGNWTAEQTGYVGAYIEEGLIVNQIRFFPRTGFLDRPVGCFFEGSVDGESWTLLYTIEEQPSGADFEFYDIEDETVYHYVRFVGRDRAEYGASYCDIAEFEIWGVPAK